VDGLGVQMDVKGWIMAMIPSSLIFTQFVSFLFFSSARTHSLFGFMPLLLFPTRQFIPVALGQHLPRACHETSHFA